MVAQTLAVDLLILGAGGAGLFAALHAHRADPSLAIAVAVKGLLGKCGCTRMVQGGYNVALLPGDSIERHFMDTVEGGAWLNDQELAWRLVATAPERVRELENELGCFFDRNPDGTLHQKAFAGQSFDRTVHKGDLTGIEIMNRLAEQVWARPIVRLEEHRAVELLPVRGGGAIAGALLVDLRSGQWRVVRARAVLLATGGGPTMYRYHTPSGDKSCDGLALALRAGAALRDLEMVQFHPTGLLAGPETRMTGTVLEEGLRGAGGHLLNGRGERFLLALDPRAERATRDLVSRAMYAEMRAGRTGPNGGLYLSVAHLGADTVRRLFPGMVERCADCGFDLAGGRVEVVPTAHYLMGGLETTPECRSSLEGLWVAGEDAGGVHGANRLGGNGVANSTVFGGVAGDAIARALAAGASPGEPDPEAIAQAIARAERPLRRVDRPEALGELRARLAEIMWNDVGIVRSGMGLKRALGELAALRETLAHTGLAARERGYNLAWQEWLNVDSLLETSEAIARAALAREESRGAHWREDFPHRGPDEHCYFLRVRRAGGALAVERVPVLFSRVRPGESLLPRAA